MFQLAKMIPEPTEKQDGKCFIYKNDIANKAKYTG